MTNSDAPISIDASTLTLLVADQPGTRAYLSNPIDLDDRAQALRTLAALRGESATVLVGIEFDDPAERGNRIVLADADLASVEFATAAGDTISTGDVLVRLDDLDHITVTGAE
ncbi:hypothetical protein [Tsukamurella spumae]|uniref:Uncharacterized protein n=1 Tax=Tsukamurella spumae TaxID=44753 RepID=A0A846X7L2_9ACTN|nr:hypothetical protein [Tsukamurella spumae]NKY20456.1 hypothetical protein [Tsukamurella spumae]